MSAVTNTMEVIDNGINILLERLGSVETERFISVILREKFDYTKWRRQLFDDVESDEFNSAAIAYERSHPFHIKSDV